MDNRTRPNQCPKTITVVIRDASPMRHIQASPSYRTVTIQFTPEQRKALELKWTDTLTGQDFYESICQAIVE